MKYLKLLAVLLLSITLAACGDKSDEESADAKDENKTEETTTETENKDDESEETDDSGSTTEGDTEADDSEESSSTTEGATETESDDGTDTDSNDDSNDSTESDDSATEDEVVGESEKEYKIGDDTTPLLGQKAMEFGQELEGKEPSSKTVDDVLGKVPNAANYILNNYLILRVKDGETANYDAVVTRSMIDESSPAKMYTEIADKETGEFYMLSYEEEGKAYAYQNGTWTEQSLGDKEHAVYGLTNNLKSAAFDNKEVFKVSEDDDNYYLEYSGPQNKMTETLSEIYNFQYQNADLSSLKFNVVYSVDKEDNTLEDVIVISRVNGQNASQSLQIEVHAEFEDYGNHSANKIKRPEGL